MSEKTSRWMVLGACAAAAASGGCYTLLTPVPDSGVCKYQSHLSPGTAVMPAPAGTTACPPMPTYQSSTTSSSLVQGASTGTAGGSGGSGGGGGYTPPH